MRAQLWAAVKLLLAITLIVGVGYPLVVTGIAQVAFADKADGSFVERDGKVVGSSLLGQAFTGAQWFRPRPSAADYDALASGGTNLGPTNPDLIDTVAQRVEQYRKANGLPANAKVPVDAVTSSGSGLDPHISEANANLQAARVAEARGLSLQQVRQLISDNTDEPSLGIFGQPGVNVLQLNLALDRASR
jgi:K+-transporting ATPase ATPase C chain